MSSFLGFTPRRFSEDDRRYGVLRNPRIGILIIIKSMSAPAAAPTASAPGALGDAVAPPAQNVVAPPRVFVLFLHALDVTPGCTRIRGGGMQAPTGALSLSSVDFFDLRNKSGESGIMRSFRARFASCRHTAARSMIVARYDQDDLTNKAQCSQTLREVQCSPCLRQHRSRRLQLQGDDLIAE